ncbi:hypothetical protein CR194_01825 [Salipaludibacillus keqinensis]|uniref:Aminodeoxychorismate lyase n=1 Tax=Salipaludibacillus keqinensis TaxID=2045207 RepID=A0A323TJB8_9BACI|nr:hypothetical protein [Salipaludibacillus keqinensis]PYZ94296.1 hypothetical protein CR194_01825 [Salipaludibacillus keqinensis]
MSAKDSFRGAAAGLFLAGTVLAATYYMQPEVLSYDETAVLEEQSETTLSKGEYEQLEQLEVENEALRKQLEGVEDSSQENDDSEEPETNTEESDPVYFSILSIEPGMTSQDISEKLVRLNIIHDSESLAQELAAQGVEDRIQLGEYTLNSDMSVEEIVTIITS